MYAKLLLIKCNGISYIRSIKHCDKFDHCVKIKMGKFTAQYWYIATTTTTLHLTKVSCITVAQSHKTLIPVFEQGKTLIYDMVDLSDTITCNTKSIIIMHTYSYMQLHCKSLVIYST